jgi:hypothetical protein
LAKPNYQYEKRQRDLAKKNKQEEKRRQKLANKAADGSDGPSPDDGSSEQDQAPAAGGSTPDA